MVIVWYILYNTSWMVNVFFSLFRFYYYYCLIIIARYFLSIFNLLIAMAKFFGLFPSLLLQLMIPGMEYFPEGSIRSHHIESHRSYHWVDLTGVGWSTPYGWQGYCHRQSGISAKVERLLKPHWFLHPSLFIRLDNSLPALYPENFVAKYEWMME